MVSPLADRLHQSGGSHQIDNLPEKVTLHSVTANGWRNYHNPRGDWVKQRCLSLWLREKCLEF